MVFFIFCYDFFGSYLHEFSYWSVECVEIRYRVDKLARFHPLLNGLNTCSLCFVVSKSKKGSMLGAEIELPVPNYAVFLPNH